MNHNRIALTVLLIGVFLRFHLLGQDTRFHPDEALFTTFARAAAVKGDWLLHGPLDKTPLSIYANALSLQFSGVQPLGNGVLDLDLHQGEFAARLPNVLASVLLIALMLRLSRDLALIQPGAVPTSASRHYAPLFAALLLAFSPFAIAFSATAFTDILMLLWAVIGLRLVIRGRWGWSGLFLTLGFASKQQGLFYLPLLILIGWQIHGLSWRRLARLFIPLFIGIALLLAWDIARDQTSIWALAATNNNPDQVLVNLTELLPRLSTWLDFGGALLGPGWLTALLLSIALMTVFWHTRDGKRDKGVMIDLILAGYVVSYGLLHWIAAFNTYDRYLLLILPPVSLLVARSLARIAAGAALSTIPPRQRLIPPFVLIAVGLIMIPAALDASEGRMNVGGDRGAHEGIDQLATYLNSKPVATVIYDHWLGWELGYYLGVWTDKRRVYYPTAAALVHDALLLEEIGPRYLPAPKNRPVTPWIDALSDAGFSIEHDYETSRFVVYRLMPPWVEADAATAGSSSPVLRAASGVE